MIYFDNAATTYKKPDSVIDSAVTTLKYLSVNAGRSSHRLAVFAEEQIYKTRKTISSFFNNDCVEQVIFTKNCTEAINLAILGTVKKGGHIITSVFEHNSILRPLYALERRGLITLSIVKPRCGNIILKEDIEREIKPSTYLVCLSCASNITGEIHDYESIGALLKDRNILFLVDGAQGAGHITLNMCKQNIDILCISAHKGLDGLQGIGALIFRKRVKIAPTFYGGSGSESFAPYPSGYPELLECGTLNLPAIVSFRESILYTSERLIEKQRKLIELTSILLKKLNDLAGIKVYSTQNPIGIVSLSYKDFSSQEIAGVLSEKFEIAVRGGFHCAPLAHQYLNTQTNGLVRVSFSQHNTEYEIEKFISALKKVDEYLF
ncbi:MAG: aminotransferase class V-fold PLP-dependent enzyme [Clostridia bacterium]|nr:aminotransferase class V-fold PLP-dependent enzyme [Clostridia bacterium]